MLNRNEIKQIQLLKSKKHRQESGLFVAEGGKVIHELLTSTNYPSVQLYAIESFIKKQPSWPIHIKVREVSEADMQRISQLQTPSEVLAVISEPSYPFQPIVAHKWSLLLDGIQDPGNLGTIIRLADWFGIGHIYATTDTANCYNPKVVQASMGSLFRVQLHYGPCETWLKACDVPIYAAALAGDNIWQLTNIQPGVLIIGHEGQGIRTSLMQLATKSVTIPRLGAAESLNAGVATGILMSHLLAKGTHPAIEI